jgi:hypothetical protein
MMEGLSPQSQESDARLRREIDRCRAEIESAKRLLRSGHPDIEGLCLALADWSAELRILEEWQWRNESSECSCPASGCSQD